MKSEKKSDIAKQKPRDNRGHFINPKNNPEKKVIQLDHSIISTLLNFKNIILVIIVLCAVFLAYDLGKFKSNCSTNTITKIGVIYSLKPINEDGLLKNFLGNLGIKLGITKNSKSNRYIIIDNQNNVIALDSKNEIKYENYFSRQVFATGKYSSCSQEMKLFNNDSLQLVP